MLQKFNKLLPNNHLLSLCKFLTVGALAALINFSSFGFFWSILKLNYQIAVSIAYIMSVTFHFFANRRYTFKSSNIKFMSQIPKYLTMVAINYFITLMVMYYVVEILQLSPYIGTLAAIAMTVGIGYTMAKFWVFSSTRSDTT